MIVAGIPLVYPLNNDGQIRKHVYPNGMLVFFAVEAEIAEYINQVGGD